MGSASEHSAAPTTAAWTVGGHAKRRACVRSFVTRTRQGLFACLSSAGTREVEYARVRERTIEHVLFYLPYILLSATQTHATQVALGDQENLHLGWVFRAQSQKSTSGRSLPLIGRCFCLRAAATCISLQGESSKQRVGQWERALLIVAGCVLAPG